MFSSASLTMIAVVWQSAISAWTISFRFIVRTSVRPKTRLNLESDLCHSLDWIRNSYTNHWSDESRLVSEVSSSLSILLTDMYVTPFLDSFHPSQAR
jgi:hypothetical protein